jgi:hypothetical protein
MFTAEVDDHGIDFVVRTRSGNHYDVQVKSFRVTPANHSAVHVHSRSTSSRSGHPLLVALVKLLHGEPPTLHLIPCVKDGVVNPVFDSRDYGEGRKSLPEWGLTLSKRKLDSLSAEYRFDTVVQSLL